MKKILCYFLLLCCIGIVNAQDWPPLSNHTYSWQISLTEPDTMTPLKYNTNLDSIQNCTGRIIDEVNSNCVHFNQGSLNHDSTVKYVQIDTIRSNPDIDSIRGRPFVDTLDSRLGYFDSIYVTNFYTALVIGDSLYLERGRIDTIYGTTATLSSGIGCDTLATTSGISVGGNANVTGDVTAANGTLTGTLDVDSIALTSGVTGTTADFSGDLTADSAAFSSGVTGTTADFSGDLSASEGVFSGVLIGSDTVKAVTITAGTCTLFDGVTQRSTVAASFISIGPLKMIALGGSLTGTITASTTTSIHIPIAWAPVNTNYKTVKIIENSNHAVGVATMVASTNVINIEDPTLDYLDAGTGGVSQISVTYY